MGRRTTTRQKTEYFIKSNKLLCTKKQYEQIYSVIEYFVKNGDSTDIKKQASLKVMPEMVRCGVDNFYIRRFKKSIKLGKAITLKKMLLLYGREGYNKWESYRNKQSLTNTFEYKNKKYGMTKDEFKQYNLSRAVTLENMIKRYGKELGTKKFEEYRKRQSYVGVKLEYFIEKNNGDYELGLKEYNEINAKKNHGIKGILARNPDITVEEAISLLENNHLKRRVSRAFVSKVSQKLFWDIYDKLNDEEKSKCYFAELNGEFSKFHKESMSLFKYDFVISSLNFCIEFNGDVFHANPKMYTENYSGFFFDNKITAKEIWERDKIKTGLLESLGFKVLIIWESEYNKNPEKCMEYILNELESSRKLSN